MYVCMYIFKLARVLNQQGAKYNRNKFDKPYRFFSL